MPTATAPAPAIPYIYKDAPFHARGFALTAVYESSWQPPPDGVWVEYGHLSRCWRHPGYPKHVLWKPEADVVVITQMAGTLSFPLPAGNFRCQRLWPVEGRPPHLEVVEEVPVELRISGTSDRHGLRLYAEAFVGRAHETRAKQPRALIYIGDARHVLLAPSAQQVKRSMARLMDALLGFAYFRRDEDSRSITVR